MVYLANKFLDGGEYLICWSVTCGKGKGRMDDENGKDGVDG